MTKKFFVKRTVPNIGPRKITIWRPILYYGRAGNWFYETKTRKFIFKVFYADGTHQLLSSETIRRSIVTTLSVPIDEVNSCRFHYWNQFLCDKIAEEILRESRIRVGAIAYP